MSRSLPRRLRTGRRNRRVLVAIPGAEYGGAERYAVRIASAAAQEGWEVAAAVRRYDGVAPMRCDLRDAGVRVLHMVRGERARELAGFLAMLAVYRPDVVHLTLPWPVVAGRLRAACALLGTPTVLVHQVVPASDELDIRHPWLYRLSRRRRQRWVAVSNYGAAMLKHAFGLPPSEELTVIHNAPRSARGDRAELPRDDPAARADARAALGLDGNGSLIVSVGRLSHEKGHDMLVAAAVRLVEEWPDVHVLIAGDGDERARIQQLIDDSGLSARVQLLGQVQDVDRLLCAADVFAFPSRREGTPFALLEAMRTALPVVAADFGGADEIIDSGENGIMVSQDDPLGLAAAIGDLLRNPERARALAVSGRESAARFSEPVMIRSTLALLGAVAGRGRQP